MVVNWTGNRASSGIGGNGGNGGTATGGFGAAPNGVGGSADGGKGGDGGFSSFGIGGGISNENGATLAINPRLGAKKGSKATDLITANQALAATGGAPGAGGAAIAGTGGPSGVATAGQPGVAHPLSIGAGGGIFTVPTATIDFTSITGNFASSLDNDVDGTIVP